jgi:hypothetical protein
MADIFVGDYGIPLEVTITVNGQAHDISNATQKGLTFKKPDGSSVSKTPTFKTDGTDGILSYTFEQGVLDMTGKWKFQAYVVTPTSGRHTEHGEIDVGSNL